MQKEDNANLIIPNLYLGDYYAANDPKFLKNNKIKYIIRVMPNIDENKMYDNIIYFHVPITDKVICDNINYDDIFKDIPYLMHRLLNSQNKKGNILVHCKRGHHRSASIVAYYLVNYKGYSLDDAIKSIKKLRPKALVRNCCIVQKLYSLCSKNNTNI